MRIKKEILSQLRTLGIKTMGFKVSASDFKKVFGATYNDPEWIVVHDYDIDIPESYVQSIIDEEGKLGRELLPSTVSAARFGKFLNHSGDTVTVDGIIYQYSMRKNPINTFYAYRLFVNGKTYKKSSSLRGIFEAENEVAGEAKKYIESELYDL